MPTPDQSAYMVGYVAVRSKKREFRETHVMKQSSWVDAYIALKHIAYARAAISARNIVIPRAVISRPGGPRAKQTVVPQPLNGSMGTKFPSASWPGKSINCNTISDGLRFSRETIETTGLNRTSGEICIRAIPDGCIADEAYALGTAPDVLSLTLGTTAPTLTDDMLPHVDLWPSPDPTTPESWWKTWPEAFEWYMKLLFHFTVFGRRVAVPSTPNQQGTPNAPQLESLNWERFLYIGVGNRRAGRPSTL